MSTLKKKMSTPARKRALEMVLKSPWMSVALDTTRERKKANLKRKL